MIAAVEMTGLADDFAADAVLITPAGVTRGKNAIRAQFEQLLRPPPTSSASNPPPRPAEDHSETLKIRWLKNH